MTKLIYFNLSTNNIIQVWLFNNRQLALWKRKQLKASGNYSQGFKVEKV